MTQPPILLWHGFGAPNSEQALMQALPLDEVPAVKIYLGLPLFGQRLPPGGMNEVAQRQSTDYLLNLLAPVASGVSDDLRTVYEELRRRGCVQGHESIDAFGYSAGGFSILYATNAGAVPVRRLALLNAPASASTAASVFEHATGHPYEWSDTSREFARRLDPTMIAAGESAFSVRMPALLLLQGESDDAALREAAVALEALLHPVYRTAHRASQLQVRRLSGVGHGWLSKQDLPVVRAALADWYNRPG